MSWWEYAGIAAVVLAGIYALLVLTSSLTGLLSYGSSRTADTMYDNYPDSRRKQRRYAGQHEGEWEGDEGTRSRDTVVTDPSERSKAAAHHPDRPPSRAA
jgi:hypothetical protein